MTAEIPTMILRSTGPPLRPLLLRMVFPLAAVRFSTRVNVNYKYIQTNSTRFPPPPTHSLRILNTTLFFLPSRLGFLAKDSLRLPLSQRDSGSEEGGSSPAGSPRPERGSLGAVVRSTHRALLDSSSLLASIGLGRCLDVPPRVPPRTNAFFLSDRTPSEPEICPTKPLVSEPPVVDDLITLSPCELLPRPFLDLPLQYQDIKPLPLTPPPPPIPRERSGQRKQQPLHSPQSPRTPLRHGRGSPGEWAPTSTSANGELDYEAWAHRAERRRSNQGLHGSQLGNFLFLPSFVHNSEHCTLNIAHRAFMLTVCSKRN